MRSIGSLLSCSFACTLSAQPVVDAGNAPGTGTAFTMHVGTYFNLPQTGPGQIWDYSIVGGGGGFSFLFEDASADPATGEFPEATLVRTGDGNRYFHGVDEDGISYHGHKSTVHGDLFLDDPRLDLILPLTYGASWSDDFSGIIGSQVITGERSCTVNGHGTLILPWGTVDEVLRVRCRMVASIGATIEHVDTLTSFYRNGFRWHLLQARKRVTFQNGQPMPQEVTLEYASQTSVVAVEERTMAKAQVLVFPSPAQDIVTIRSRLLSSLGTIRLVDGQGRLVRTMGFSESPWRDEFQMDVSDLSSGVYLLQFLTDGGSAIQSHRFSVMREGY